MNDELELDGNWTVGNVARKRHGTTVGMGKLMVNQLNLEVAHFQT